MLICANIREFPDDQIPIPGICFISTTTERLDIIAQFLREEGWTFARHIRDGDDWIRRYDRLELAVEKDPCPPEERIKVLGMIGVVGVTKQQLLELGDLDGVTMVRREL